MRIPSPVDLDHLLLRAADAFVSVVQHRTGTSVWRQRVVVRAAGLAAHAVLTLAGTLIHPVLVVFALFAWTDWLVLKRETRKMHRMEEGGPEAEEDAGWPLLFREDRFFTYGRLLQLILGVGVSCAIVVAVEGATVVVDAARIVFAASLVLRMMLVSVTPYIDHAVCEPPPPPSARPVGAG